MNIIALYHVIDEKLINFSNRSHFYIQFFKIQCVMKQNESSYLSVCNFLIYRTWLVCG